MTAGTAANDLQMINRYGRDPGIRAVTVFAHISGRNVVESLAVLDGAIMATDAVANDAIMAEGGGKPTVGRMAIAALSGGRQMIRRQPIGGSTVMATGAGADHLEMIDCEYWVPHVGGMAVLAHISRGDVVEALAILDGAIMATDAIASDS